MLSVRIVTPCVAPQLRPALRDGNPSLHRPKVASHGHAKSRYRQSAAYNLYEESIDCSNVDAVVATVTKAIDAFDMPASSRLFRLLGVTMKFVSDKLVDSPIGPAMHVQDAVLLTLENAKAHSTINSPNARAFAEQVDEIVTSRLGEMPMPGEAQHVVKALGGALKNAGKELSAEHTGSR